jgi:hypothetical protein
MPEKSSATVDVICDLREFAGEVNDVGTLQNLWPQLSQQIAGQLVPPGKPLQIRLPEGQLALWVVESHGITQLEPDVTFEIIDVLRNPQLLYRCSVCGEYGPLRCSECEQTGRETRLCSAHAHTIKDELKAYCPEHIPHCNCRPGCAETAVFRCQRCHKLFGQHYHRHHPNDTTVDYCHTHYRLLFETCATPNCHHLGKSKCAYQTREMPAPCQKPLCAEHSYQWKIWGPHNRGVTLCEHHKQMQGATDPADLLFIMLIARPPYARRGKRQSLPNPFRLRRIINRNRAAPLTFDQIGASLRSLESRVSTWGKPAESNYRYLLKTFTETTSGLSNVENDLLTQVKAFYQRAAGLDAARQIVGLEITDRFYKPGQPPRYRVVIHLNTSNKGPYIGRGGATINQLSVQLNIEVDLQ